MKPVSKKRAAVIVCPGSGDEFTSERDAEPIVLHYCASGFHSFVLEYSVAPSGFPAAVCELSWLEKYVTPETPPCFIRHTRTDRVVPVVSSLRFAGALEANNVDFELHIYPTGEHGLSTGDAVTAAREDRIVPSMQSWMDMSIRWINNF